MLIVMNDTEYSANVQMKSRKSIRSIAIGSLNASLGSGSVVSQRACVVGRSIRYYKVSLSMKKHLTMLLILLLLRV